MVESKVMAPSGHSAKPPEGGNGLGRKSLVEKEHSLREKNGGNGHTTGNQPQVGPKFIQPIKKPC